ncbi:MULTISPECIES: AraC family transcriptional regulator [unclassified Leeuwenhoekiella]|uniref:AraC family transcriptional regulator n=1 Tax=unclassified Leeuwenhoekiella TaxID=2615029 RepID=UPI000C5BFD98|nr:MULTISPECIES: AraC family transcriptional regulator [unclassified Leeuwenhoekiella]MAW94468.1 AraC family transcriptional regulator [Leeuwenhoekiella sp.]MAW96964.1 AraC family transcriptional regulator [Leeuwenhoekiella sp.]MBA81146.1 AraC family transcriptional regulator [Leeuwenhoekiella sp.]|tara:strand:- start:29659 stop:30501 length:843 start_codon:yes stop_codon:yes gene_type:complete
MKILPFKVPKPGKESLVYQEDREMRFYDKLHEHEEIQISYIVKGSGSLILGDTVNEYKPGDILIIGEKIPHVFRSDSDIKEESVMYSLFFTKSSFGKDFFNLSDLTGVENFFKKSDHGMKIVSQQSILYKKFEILKEQNRIQRVATFLQILDILIHAESTPLSSFIYQKPYSDDEGKRMNDVLQFTLDNYQENIALEEVAEKANMSKNAFCRYFKKRTNKTYFQFLIDLRIEQACKLLYNKKDLSIGVISELSGFPNVANFNRKFKELKQMTPSEYRASI